MVDLLNTVIAVFLVNHSIFPISPFNFFSNSLTLQPISWFISNIGRQIDRTIKPTMNPMLTIMIERYESCLPSTVKEFN